MNQGRSRVNRALNQGLDYIRRQSRRSLALVLGPPILLLVIFFVLPLLSMLWLSFQTALPPEAMFTLQNYQRLIGSSAYVQIFQTTLVLTVLTTGLVTVIGYSLMYSIVRLSRHTTILLLLVILPFWTNYIIRMYAWINILQPGGVLDFVLISLGLLQQPSGFLYNRAAVLVGFIYVWLPLAMLPFYASLASMDEDLIEAAKDLGSGPIKTFLTITLPMTKDGIVAGIALVAIPTFGSFITPTLLGGTNVTMVGVVIARQFNQAFNWPLGSALGIAVSIFVVVALLVSVKLGGDLYGMGGEI
jgi:spermidine/putrescine transport system permease protein